MKRSEAIQVIIDTLYKASFGEVEITQSEASAVLDELEDIGMAKCKLLDLVELGAIYTPEGWEYEGGDNG